jgi:cytoskeletal protein RodZ
MSTRQVFCVILSLSLFLGLFNVVTAKSVPTDTEMPSQQAKEEDEFKEWNNQIRREKFDIVLPEVMRKNNVDMSHPSTTLFWNTFSICRRLPANTKTNIYSFGIMSR